MDKLKARQERFAKSPAPPAPVRKMAHPGGKMTSNAEEARRKFFERKEREARGEISKPAIYDELQESLEKLEIAEPVWKIATVEESLAWEAAGRVLGSDLDARDGFVHCSNAKMIKTVAARYFQGRHVKLLRLRVDALRVSSSKSDAAVAKATKRDGKARVRVLDDGCLHVHLAGEGLLIEEIFDLPLGDDDTHTFPAACC